MSEESDPFECRLTFLALLKKVNASQQSIHKVAIYAMRHRNLSEDLYNCLIEQLEQVRYFSLLVNLIKYHYCKLFFWGRKKETEKGKYRDKCIDLRVEKQKLYISKRKSTTRGVKLMQLD